MQRRAMRSTLALCVSSLLWLSCSREPLESPPIAAVAVSGQALFKNGDFEADALDAAPSDWTVKAYLNRRVSLQSPQTLAGLNLDATGGDLATRVVGGMAQESGSDPVATDLHFPRYGLRSAVVNFAPPINGNNTNANALRQQMAITAADVDPDDGRIHIRFVLAPVLENPNHDVSEQPYYFVQVRNLTRNTLLYQDFQISNQPGVPWLNTGNGTLYTDWQLVDVAPEAAALESGETVEAEVIAAGCAFTAHFGRVYVDAFGSDFPGLFTSATAPKTTLADSDLSYAVHYKNGADETATNAVLEFVTPPNTTFVSTDRSTGCTAPAIGTTGTVTCTLGDLAADAAGDLIITVHVLPSATGKITQGNYAIRSDGESPLLGSHVVTTIPNAELTVNVRSELTVVGWQSPVTYTISVENTGSLPASGVTVRDVIPAQLTGATWTCSGSSGGTCAASGSGNVVDTSVNLPVGGRVVYTLTATTIAATGNGQGTVVQTATATLTLPNGATIIGRDTETLDLRVVKTITLTKSAPGRVVSGLAGLICGIGCTNSVGRFATGSDVVLTALPPVGGRFEGWGGACASQATARTCRINPLDDDVQVSAMFRGPRVTIASGTPQQTKVLTAFGTPLAVNVVDADGAPVSDVTVQFVTPQAGASAVLSTTDAVSDASGRASVTATANANPGGYQVVASAVGSTDGAPFMLTNLGGATRLTLVEGDGQHVPVDSAAPRPLVVRVTDENDVPLSGITVTFTAPSTGASAVFTAPSTSSDANGLASTTFAANAVTGSYVITATATATPTDGGNGTSSLTSAQSNDPGAADTIATTTGSTPQSTRVDTDFSRPLQVRVVDRFGNPVPNVLVRFIAPNGEATATLTAGEATTDDQGEASVTAHASQQVGSYRVSAELPDGTATAFELDNTLGDTVQITVSEGGDQTGTATRAFGDPVSISVRDEQGNPAIGVHVTVKVTDGTGTGTTSATEIVTDDSGRASVDVTAGTQPGSFTLEFTMDGGSTPVTTVLTIDPIPTATALEVPQTSVQIGTAVTLTATVTSQTNTPHGRVQFIVDGQPAGESDLDDSGHAELQYTGDALGTRQITATFTAHDSYGESTSNAVPLEITSSTGVGVGQNQLDGGSAEDTTGWKLAGGSGTCSLTRAHGADGDNTTLTSVLWLLGCALAYRRARACKRTARSAAVSGSLAPQHSSSEANRKNFHV